MAEPVDIGELREKIAGGDHGKKAGSRDRWIAVYISVLAVCLALVGLGGSNATKEMINNNVAAADAYAFYQAKNIRQTSIQLAADQLQIILASRPELTEAARKDIEAMIKRYRETADRYESEPATGDGKKELIEKAKHYVDERDKAQRKDPYFDYSQALFQVAIVLASVCIVTGLLGLLFMSYGLSIIGVLLMINGFTLAVHIPFLD